MMRTRDSAGHRSRDKHFVRLGLQGIARQNGDGFAENFVAGGPAPAQIVIVERGQIVVDQRIGVQHFERRAELFNSRRKGTGDHAPGFHAENGTQPLAAGEHTVPHRLVDRNRMLRCRRQQTLQRRVGQRLALLQSLFEHAGEYNKPGGHKTVWGGHSCPPLLKLILIFSFWLSEVWR